MLPPRGALKERGSLRWTPVLAILLLGVVVAAPMARPVHADAVTLNLGSCGGLLAGSWDSNTSTCTLNSPEQYSVLIYGESMYIPSGTTLVVNGANTLDDFGGIDNYGTVDNYGTTNNLGVTGITMEGVNFTNYGVLNNYGYIYLQTNTAETCVGANSPCKTTIENGNGGTVNNQGYIISVEGCSFDGCAGFGEVRNDAGATFTNSGSIELADLNASCATVGGGLIIHGGSCFRNSGTFRTVLNDLTCPTLPVFLTWNSASDTCEIATNTVFNNTQGYDIIVPAGITLSVAGTLNNTGQVDNSGSILDTYDIMNTGVITDSPPGAITIVLGDATCYFSLGGSWSGDTCRVNSGTRNALPLGYVLQMGQGVTFLNQGTLSLGGSISDEGNFTNAGNTTVGTTGAITLGGVAGGQNVPGTLKNAAGGNLTNGGSIDDDPGGSLLNLGALTNTGQIESFALSQTQFGTMANGAGGTLVDSGLILLFAPMPNSGSVTLVLNGVTCQPYSAAIGGQFVVDGTYLSGTCTTGFVDGYSQPLDVPKGWTLEVDPGVGLVNQGEFLINGTLVNSGSVTNQGVFVSGMYQPNTGLFELNGTLANSGTFVNENSGSFDVFASGTVDNSGTITSQGNSEITNENVFTNSGTLNVDSLTLSTYGTLTNAAGGTINNGAEIDVYGSLANAAGASIVNDGNIRIFSSFADSGSLSGMGAVTVVLDSATCPGYLSGAWASGTCTLSPTGSVAIQSGVALEIDSGTSLDNQGTLTLGGAVSNGGAMTNSGTLLVEGTGSISNGEGSTFSNAAGGTMTVDGSVSGTYAAFTNAGTLTIGAAGTFDSSGSSNLGFFSNSGDVSILGTFNSGGANFTSSGAVTVGGTLQVGDFLDLAQVMNSGTITVQPEGVVTGNPAGGVFNNTGTVVNLGSTTSSDFYGISLGGTLANWGTFQNGGTLSMNEGQFVNTGLLNNSGNAELMAADNSGLFLNSGLACFGFGTFTNEPTGNVTNQNGGEFCVGDLARMVNQGSVTNRQGGTFFVYVSIPFFTQVTGSTAQQAVGSVLAFDPIEPPVFLNAQGGTFANYGNFTLGGGILLETSAGTTHVGGAAQVDSLIAGGRCPSSGCTTEEFYIGNLTNDGSFDNMGLINEELGGFLNNSGTVTEGCSATFVQDGQVSGAPVSPSACFSLSPQEADATAQAGGQAAFQIDVQPVAGSADVTLSVASGLPAGATASFAPGTVSVSGTSDGTSTLTVSVPPGSPLGDFTLTVQGAAGGVTKTATVTLHVYDFALTVVPNAATAAIGQSSVFGVTATLLPGSSTVGVPLVELSVQGCPSAGTCGFSPTSLTPTLAGSDATLAVATATSTPSGLYSMTVSASPAAGASRSAPLSLTVDRRTTTLTVECPGTAVNQATTCTATVADTDAGTPSTPTMSVGSFTDGGAGGSFDATSCTLSSGSCTFTYTPPPGTAGTPITIGATYEGDADHLSSTGSTTLTPTARATSVTIDCPTTPAGVATTCQATVADTSAGTPITPTGAVDSYSDGGAGGTFGPASCSLSAGLCTFTYTPPGTAAGTTITISATYGGDSNHLTSSGTTSLSVMTPNQAITYLVSAVNGSNLAQGIENSLILKLNAANGSLANGNPNAAVNQLNAFIHEVNAQTGKQITQAQARLLTAEAQAIIDSLQS